MKVLSSVPPGTTAIARGKAKVMQNFGGQTRCIMGEVKMANSKKPEYKMT